MTVACLQGQVARPAAGTKLSISVRQSSPTTWTP